MMMKSNKFMTAYLQIIKESSEPKDEEMNVNGNDTVENKKEDAPATSLKQVCFKTTDAVLIDAINSGFEEIVIFTKAKDENGEDTVVEVKFSPESFGEISVCDVEDGECCPECGNNPCECDPNTDPEVDPKGDEQNPVTECGEGNDGDIE